jgi:hypothetical protein
MLEAKLTPENLRHLLLAIAGLVDALRYANIGDVQTSEERRRIAAVELDAVEFSEVDNG